MHESDATPEHGKLLLTLARHAIAVELGAEAAIPVLGNPPAGWLESPGASFVTLKLEEELRGCIGTLQAQHPLRVDVIRNAAAAAFHDYRFEPLTAREYRRISLEVSVLSPLTPLPVADEADALAKLRPGIDGVLIERGSRRATFLPQVWEELPRPVDFLRHLKLKAGLPGDFWSRDLSFSRYSVFKFSEETAHAAAAKAS